MTRQLQLTIHIGRKGIVRSATRDADVDLPSFYRDDEVLLGMALVNDAAAPTAAAPFTIVDTAGWDLRAAIGNGLTGTARRLLAQTLSFTRDAEGVFHGKLSLRTTEAAGYLAFPGAYDPGEAYSIGAEVYHDGSTFRALSAIDAGESPAVAPHKWMLYEIHRDDLYFEVSVVRPEGTETVLQARCTLSERVIQQPPVSPEPIENADALADLMASRLSPSASIAWDRNRDPHVPGTPAAPTYHPLASVPYLSRVWHTPTQKFYQAIRDIKAPVALAATYDITLDHLPAEIDGVVPVGHERIGALNNFNPATNGIYTVEPQGDSLIPDGATFNAEGPGGIGVRQVTVVSGLLYFIELAGGETATNGFEQVSQNGTLPALTTQLTLRGVYGAPVRSIIRPAGAVRAPDAMRPDQLVPGTVFRVLGGATAVGKRYGLTSEVSVVGASHQFWSEIGGATGAIEPTELGYFAEALPGYGAPAHVTGGAYNVGDQYRHNGKDYAVHTAATGEAPDNRRYSGELLTFNPSTYLVASVRVVPGGGLAVTPDGVVVDMEAVAPNTFEVASEGEMTGLDPTKVKVGDYAIRSDLLGRPYRLRQLPASTVENWVSLDAERIEVGDGLATSHRHRTGGLARIGTQQPHGLVNGNEVSIRHLGGSGYNLTGVPVTVVNAWEFNYPSPGADEGTVADTGGIVFKLIPVVTRPVTLTDAMPAELVVGGVGTPGTGQRAAREDHAHPMPGLATADAPGFLSPQHFEILESLGGDAGPELGFDGSVHALLVADGKVWVGGEFSRYGTASRSRLALLDNRGRIDPVFDPQTGFAQPIIRLAMTTDGDIVAGSGVVNNYRGLAGGHVWKLHADGTPNPAWNCPIPLASMGENVLVGLTASGNAVVAITPQSLRILDGLGGNIANANANGPMHDVVAQNDHSVWVSSAAFNAGGAELLVNGISKPRALKLLGTQPGEDCPCAAGSNLPSFAVGAGDGANASIRRLILHRGTMGYGDSFVIGGTPRNASEEHGLDHSWDGGNALRFRGLYRIRIDGQADDGFEIDLTLSEAGAAIPFASDSMGRIYFGGPVSAINGVSVTPWRLYRISATGEFDREFAAFNGRVRCAALLDDHHLVVGGDFTKYGTRPAGRITFLSSAGEMTLPSTSATRGGVVTRFDLPDVSSQPTARFDLIRMPAVVPGEGVRLFVYDDDYGWLDICSLCGLRGVQLPYVSFDPPSGTAIGGGISIALGVPGYATALIRYTLDGSNPTAQSTLYTGPITVDVPTTIKAFAMQQGVTDGPLSVAQYGVDTIEQLPPPTLSPSSGSPPLTVTILPPGGHPDADLFYTTDGVPPSEAGHPYSGPISVTVSGTIRAIASKPGYRVSVEAAATYTAPVPPPPPQFTLMATPSRDYIVAWVPGAATSAALAGIQIQVRIPNGPTSTLRNWETVSHVAGATDLRVEITLRQGAYYPYSRIVEFELRARMPNGATSHVVQGSYFGR